MINLIFRHRHRASLPQTVAAPVQPPLLDPTITYRETIDAMAAHIVALEAQLSRPDPIREKLREENYELRSALRMMRRADL